MVTVVDAVAIETELRALAEAADPDGAIVTLYLDAWQDQHQREVVRTFVRRAVTEARRTWRGPAAAAEGLERDLVRIERAVEELAAPGDHRRPPGVAIFACAARALFKDFRAPIPFCNQFGIGRTPLLAQLSVLADEYEPALLAVVGAREARIFQLALGAVVSEADLASDVPGRHKQGGWAAARYQRHIQAHKEEHYKAVAAVVVEALERGDARHLILGGPREARLQMRHVLPTALEGRIIGEVDLPLRVEVLQVQGAVRAALQEWERRHEVATVRDLLERAGNPDQAVLGLPATLAASNRRVLHLLCLADNFAAEGGACPACGGLEGTAALGCPRCGAALAPADLREALVLAALRTGAGIEWVKGNADLQRHGGVGGFLRNAKGGRG
jgi:peptide chain release factor subunit 1